MSQTAHAESTSLRQSNQKTSEFRLCLLATLTALQHAATHCNTQQHTAAHCSTLQHTAAHCSTLQHTAAHCSTLQLTTAHYSTLQHSTTHRHTLQLTATNSSTLSPSHSKRAQDIPGTVWETAVAKQQLNNELSNYMFEHVAKYQNLTRNSHELMPRTHGYIPTYRTCIECLK